MLHANNLFVRNALMVARDVHAEHLYGALPYEYHYLAVVGLLVDAGLDSPDDIVIGIITNTLRFRHVLYEGFIELVKHGMIVPAFDGFEEMFVDGSSEKAVYQQRELARTPWSGRVMVRVNPWLVIVWRIQGR